MRGQGGFDDRLGPTILTIALFAAVVVNFVLRLTIGDQKKQMNSSKDWREIGTKAYENMDKRRDARRVVDQEV